ncbi:TetR/AcrR family transcriptional regulator [Qipengyuania sp. ASV99]|uniref:TetR/AcrR family transcriptional regulator n=1 Tax=Qipengyuania sp. ASV99 TaxID=3399681 RepID=UPI003A4C5D25
MEIVQDTARERLLAAAHRQFAERGFYGASIAQIAGEVGLTKQALLYHFRRKEDLYREVLKGIAWRLLGAMRAGVDTGKPPEQQFEDMILRIYAAARANPLDSKVLMRELLEDQRSQAPADEWFFKTYLDQIVDMLNQIETLKPLTFAQKFAHLYSLLSAIEYFVASEATLVRFYGRDDFNRIADSYPDQLRAQVRQFLEPR